MTDDIRVHVLDRGRIETDVNHPVEAAVTATATDPDPDLVRGEGVVYNLVVEHPETTILWDTGIHPEAATGHWPADLVDRFTPRDPTAHGLRSDLASAGFDLGDIDAVVQSHLHCDHAGGLEHFADGETPVYVHRREIEHAALSARTDAGDRVYVADDFDHDLPWEVVHGERRTVAPGVELIHLPGHTPGLLGLLVRLDPPVLFTGDQAYVAANYEEGRPLGAGLLWSRPDWLASLDRLRDIERRLGATVVYGHDPDQFPAIRDGWG